MKKVAETFEKLCVWASYASVAGLVFAILFLPTKSVLKFVNLTPETLDPRYYNFSLFSLSFVSILFFLLIRFWKKVGGTRFQPLPLDIKNSGVSRGRKEILWVQVLFTILILGRVLYGMDRPFDTDELTMPVQFINGTFTIDFGWFFVDGSHPLSTLLSLAMMKTFGTGIYTARAGTVLLSCFFLYVLFVFCQRQRFKLSTVVLIYSHILASEILTWYMHSTRGYVFLMLVMLVLFQFVYDAIRETRPLSKKGLVLFCSILLFLPFAHGYAVVFALMFFTAQIVWFYFNESTQAENYRQNLMRLLIAQMCFLPYFVTFLLVAYSNTTMKWRHVLPGSPQAKENLVGSIQLVMGSSHILVVKILALLTVGLLVYRILKGKPIKDSFTPLVLFLFLGFAQCSHVILENYITARFFLGVPVLFVFWFSELIGDVPKRIVPAFWGLAFLCLVAFPVYDGDPEMFQISRTAYFKFVKSAKKQLKGVSSSCIDYTYSGAEPAPVEMLVTKHFYFPISKASSETCSTRYLLHFGWPWQEEPTFTEEMRKIASFSDIPMHEKYQQIYTDNQGRFIAETLQNSSMH